MSQLPNGADGISSLTGPTPETRRFAILTVLVCLVVTVATLWIGRGRDFIRNADEAAYAEQARSLLEDGSLTVGFARHYHVQYPPEIDHPEDFYPPGNGALIAASWLAFGRSDFASSIPSILLAGLIVPLLAFALARRLHASPAFAFGCAVTMLANVEYRFHAFQGLADLPLCATVLAALVASLGRGAWGPILAGVALGAGFWFKPTALLLVPGIALAVALADRRPLRETCYRLALFGVAMAVVCAPWLIRNQLEFGDPLYSGNKHLSATANDPAFRYTDIRKVYWFDAAHSLPTLEGSVGRFGIGPVVRRFLAHLYEVVVDHGTLAFGLFFTLAALILSLHRRVFIVLVVIVSYVVALSAVFAVYYRYLMPVFPMVAAVAWVFAERITRRVLRAPGTPLVRKVFATPARIAVLLAILGSLPGATQFVRDLLIGKHDFAPRNEVPMHQAALWAREHLPADARVMTTEALTFRHTSGLHAVNTPWDSPPAMDAVAEHHRVGYLIVPDSGQFTDVTVKYLGPYLDQCGARWSRHPLPPETRFAVYVRDGAAQPR